jgi:hypothetical protein
VCLLTSYRLAKAIRGWPWDSVHAAELALAEKRGLRATNEASSLVPYNFTQLTDQVVLVEPQYDVFPRRHKLDYSYVRSLFRISTQILPRLLTPKLLGPEIPDLPGTRSNEISWYGSEPGRREFSTAIRDNLAPFWPSRAL